MPNRILKESICSSETLSHLTDFEENFFYKLMVNCDDYGRLDARPAILKARCYPLRKRLTHKQIDDALESLVRAGCVECYAVGDKPYLRLPTWEVHQQVRAKKSKFPAPAGNRYQAIADDGNCPRNPIQSESESVSEPEPDLFARFWQAYPKKNGRAAAERAFVNIQQPGELIEKMLAAIAAAAQSRQWCKESGRYIPNPATWLTERRWEDEAAAAHVAAPKGRYSEPGFSSSLSRAGLERHGLECTPVFGHSAEKK